MEKREPYWDYMGRKLRESRTMTTREDLMKKDIAEMQKTLQWCFIRIKELNDEIHEIKSSITNTQLEMTWLKNDDKNQLELKL